MPMEIEIEVTESSFVVPSQETPKNSIWLSNLDLAFRVGYCTPTITVYRPNGDPDFFSVQTLKAALAKALVHFYPLAGRLGVGRDGRIEIQCTGEGVLFEVARSSSSLDVLLDQFRPCKEMRELLVPKSDGCRCIMIQVIFFSCGGVCLSIATSHLVMDGASAFNFINSWAGIARGSGAEVVLSLDRTVLRQESPPEKTVPLDPWYEVCNPGHRISNEPSASAILRLSKDQLTSLKDSITGGRTRRASTFEAVTAFVWRCVCKARGLGADQETKVILPVDFRRRIKPELPLGYFGNAVVMTTVNPVRAGDFLSAPLTSIAERVHETVARVDNDYVRAALNALEKMEDKTVTNLVKGQYTNRDIWVNSWANLPMFEADFGWGRPVFLGRAELDVNGKFYITRNREDDGGIKLLMTLEEENMPRFLEVFHQDLGGLSGSLSMPIQNGSPCIRCK